MQSLLETYDVNEATAFEQSLPPGDYCIRLTIAEPLSRADVRAIKDYLAQNGAVLLGVKLQGSDLYVSYRRPDVGVGFAWVALIPLLTALIIPLTVVFGIFKIEDISKALIPLILVVGGVVILILAAGGREPITEAIKRF